MRIGISSCLLGENVRYDGNNKLDRYIRDTIGKFVEWVPICPEVMCGLTVPREAMRLVKTEHGIRLLTIRTKIDHTDRMMEWMEPVIKELYEKQICGFIFKAKSPSSGMAGVKIYNQNGDVVATGSGLFAAKVMEQFPMLPVIDEGRLHDPTLRGNFLERIFAFDRWKRYLQTDKKSAGLVEFHEHHKLLLMSHSLVYLRRLGKLVGNLTKKNIESTLEEYSRLFIAALGQISTVNKNTNVLHHAMGYFKKQLTPDEKKELVEVIDTYHKGLIPLIVPVMLLRHYIRLYDQKYLKGQYYFDPHPMELMLRNHV